MNPAFTRRYILQVAGVALLAPAASPANAQLSLSTAINRAARFRALSQRCAKAYAQQFLEILPENARDTLDMAQRLIQVGFEDLSKGSYPAAVGRLIQVVKAEAAVLTAQLATPPSKSAVNAVAAQSDRMLAAAHKATEALEQLSRQATAKLVNLAGRQRMLSQRLARNYFLTAVGSDANPLREQSNSDMTEFKQALAALAGAPISTPSIRNELSLAEAQWVFFVSALQRKPEPEALRTVATTSERLLEVMNNLTNLYDSALREVLGSA